MKIAFLSTYPEKKCGIGYYTKHLVDELKINDKIDEIIVIGDLESTKADYMIDFKSFYLYKHVIDIIKKEHVDVLHIQHEYYRYSKTNLNLLILYYIIGIPIVTKLSSLFSKNSNIPFLEKIRANFVEKVISSRSKKIVVTTGASKDELENFPTNKVVQIPLGIETINFEKEKVSVKKNILFFGIVSSHKGVEYLIKSSKYLRDVNIIVAGKPNMDLKEINSLKDEYSIYNEIIFDFGWISDEMKDDYFKNADLIVLPYTKTGFQSGVLYDGFSYCIPCVVSRGGRMGNVVTEYKLGEVINPKDPEDIANGINEVLNDYYEYQNNVSRYQKIANWKNVANMYTILYEDVIKEK